jgi:hypothetical protein
MAQDTGFRCNDGFEEDLLAQGTNKPDLSDLKARLGLQKPGAAKATEQSQDSAQAVAEPSAAPRASGPPGAARVAPPGNAQPGPAAGGPAQAGPPTASRPVGAPASAAPPAAAPRPASNAGAAPAAASSRSSARASSSADVVLDSEDLKAAGGSTFSPMMLMLFGALLIIGVIFGWAASSSMANSGLYNSQTADAARIHEALVPKVAEFEKAKAAIAKLSPTKVDFEAAAALAEFDFAPDGNLLRGNRLLLGPKLITDLTAFTVDSNMLKAMLAEHHYMTNTVDKEELKKIMENNELLDKERFAVLFDYDHLAANSGGDSYMPKPGRLVTVTSMKKGEDGKIEVSLLNSNDTVKTLVQGILPLAKSDILKSGGPNALQRYKKRIERIQRMTVEVDQRTGPMMTSLKELGSREPAGLF